ncbi:hypothetical protein F5Y10DRAFT_272050 [Nemania abortiva]|nr:hypothetical protein F5Y10DRAFT_272050 [Nemania abortiva]
MSFRLGLSKDLPSSPWATRFPVEAHYQYVQNNKNHSVFAPEQPRVDDPKYYDQEPLVNRATPSYAEMGRIFIAEAAQVYGMVGLSTWQAATLNRRLCFSRDIGYISGGHRPADRGLVNLPFAARGNNMPRFGEPQTYEEYNFEVYERGRIKVDETKWLPFIRKDRWFDWIDVEPEFEREAGMTWSVDDPKLQTILYGRLDYWDKNLDILGPEPHDDATILVNLATEQKWARQRGVDPCPWDWISTFTSTQWRERLTALLSKVAWSMTVTAPAEASTFQFGHTAARHTSMVCVSTMRVKDLIDGDRTLRELCTMQVDMAMTLVHELMHALGGARFKLDEGFGYAGTLIDRKRSPDYILEPFVNAEDIAELGHVMDQAFFGGVKSTWPTPGRKDTPSLAFIFTEFPYINYARVPSVPGSAFAQPGAAAISHFTPSTWISKMLSESFWQDKSRPNKSAHNFYRNQVFVSRSPNPPVGPIIKWERPVVQDPRSMPFNDPDDEVAVNEWQAREMTLLNFRNPWWAPYHYDWFWSPWGDLEIRRRIDLFAEKFARKDTLMCTVLGNYLVRCLPWQDPIAFPQNLPTAKPVNFSGWAWHSIGLLMLASLPLQRSAELSRTEGQVQWSRELAPSKAASAARHDEETITLSGQFPPASCSVAATQIYDPLGTGLEVEDITQLDYFIVFDRLQQHLARTQALVHTSFLSALLTAREKLQAERVALTKSYPGKGHTARWASRWHFEMPDYDPRLCAFANGQWTGAYIPGRNL